MAVQQSDYAKGIINLAAAEQAGETITHFLSMAIPAAGFPLNDIIEMGIIPAGMRVVDMTLQATDLDGATALLLDVGVMSGEFGDDDASRTCGNEFFQGDDVGQAGGVSRMSKQEGFSLAATPDSHRSIGIKIATAAGTPAAGTIRLTVQLASE